MSFCVLVRAWLYILHAVFGSCSDVVEDLNMAYEHVVSNMHSFTTLQDMDSLPCC